MTGFFLVSPVPVGKQRGWTVEIDGVPSNAAHIRLSNPKVGVLEYGLRPEGFDGWAFAENGGGGSISIPFTRDEDDNVLIGVIIEDRKNMGGKQPCAIGGFVDPGESHMDAALREQLEEADLIAEVSPLKGLPGNSNRLLFVADPTADQGVHPFGVEIPFAALEKRDDGSYGFRSDIPPELRGKVMAKGGGDVRFMPWKRAIRQSPDVLFRAGVAQLLTQIF